MKIALDSKILLIPNGWAIMMTFQLKWWFWSCMLKVSCRLRLFCGVPMFWWSYDRKLLSPFLCYTIFYLRYNLSKLNCCCCFFTCPPPDVLTTLTSVTTYSLKRSTFHQGSTCCAVWAHEPSLSRVAISPSTAISALVFSPGSSFVTNVFDWVAGLFRAKSVM